MIVQAEELRVMRVSGRGAPNWRAALAALSLANLCLIRVWGESSLFLGDTRLALLKLPHGSTHYIALAVNMVLLALLFRFAEQRMRDRTSRGVTAVYWVGKLVVLLVVLNAARLVAARAGLAVFTWIQWRRALGNMGAYLLAVCVMGVVVWAFVRHGRRLSAVLGQIVLVMSPLVVLNGAALAVSLWRLKPALWADLPVQQAAASGYKGPRIVVVVFDEWDYRLSFETTRRGVDLPTFKRLRGETIFFQQAIPASRTTLFSIPALTTGQAVKTVRVEAPGGFWLESGRGTSVRWEDAPNIFKTARAHNLRTALVGWYLPYCRVFGADCVSCKWWPAALAGFPQTDNLARAVWWQINYLFDTSSASMTGQTVERDSYVRMHQEMEAAAVEVAGNPAYDLAFLHLPTMHQPFIYDAKSEQFSLMGSPIRGYWDALSRADRVMSEIETAMRASGTWDSSLVVLTSDHSFRSSDLLDGVKDERVPLLVKLPSSRAGREIVGRTETRRLPDLVRAVLRRPQVTASEVVAALAGEERRP